MRHQRKIPIHTRKHPPISSPSAMIADVPLASPRSRSRRSCGLSLAVRRACSQRGRSRRECNARHPRRRSLAATTLSRCRRAAFCGFLTLSTLPVPLPATHSQQQNAIVIDDFESGTLASWKIQRSGAGGWFVYTNGKTAPNPPESHPNIPFAVPDAPQGKFAAVTDMDGPGRRILYRDVKLDGRYTLRLTVFYVNAGPLSSPNTLDCESADENQQYRIDIVAPSAPVDSLAAPHVLANVFRTSLGDADRREPSAVTVDVSNWEGQTVRLRLASVDKSPSVAGGSRQHPSRAGWKIEVRRVHGELQIRERCLGIRELVKIVRCAIWPPDSLSSFMGVSYGDAPAKVLATWSCGGGGVRWQSPPTAPAPSLANITVNGSDLLLIGQSETFTAVGNTGLPVGTASWGADAPTVVTVEGYTGRVTAVGTGTATIFADLGGIRGTKTIRTVARLHRILVGLVRADRLSGDR